MFMEDQTIKNIDKSRNPTLVYESLVDSKATPSSSVHGEGRFRMIHPVHMIPHMKMVVLIMVTIMVRHQLLRTNPLLLEDPRAVSTRYDPSEYVLLIDG